MPWRLIERRIGRAGGLRQRTHRQREWDRKYGEDNWQIGYVVDGQFIAQDDALESIYYRSYAEHFAAHPDDLRELIATAKTLRNPHAAATTSVDLQVPAIMTYLQRHNLQLHGRDVVDIGSWEGQASHPLSIRLSPLHIPVTGNPKLTLENFWQSKNASPSGNPIREANARADGPKRPGFPRAMLNSTSCPPRPPTRSAPTTTATRS